MLELVPRPVAADLPFVALLRAVADLPSRRLWPLGVWSRSRRRVTVVARHGRRCHILLIDHDLGSLVHHCPAIVVRLGADTRAVASDDLVRARALRLVVRPPLGRALRALRAEFPDALGAPPCIEIPLSRRSAEEVLAACAAVRGRIVRSRIVYGHVTAVDSPPGGPLG